MTDTELRHLARLLAQNQDDYSLWGQYIQAGARIGAYSPDNWNSFVSWITGATQQIIVDQAYDYQAAQTWNAAEDQVNVLLHHIRNTHSQLSAAALAPIIQRFLSQIYSKDRAVHDEPPGEYGIFPVVIIDHTYRIMYDEQLQYNDWPPVIRKPGLQRFETTGRPILDTIPQYLIEVDHQYGGTQWEPPDSEPETIAVAYNLKSLLTQLVFIMETEETQEIYYDAREEGCDEETYPDTRAESYRLGTFQLVKEVIASLFQKYKINRFEATVSHDALLLELLVVVDGLHVRIRQANTRNNEPFVVNVAYSDNPHKYFSRGDFRSPHQLVDLMWRVWLDQKLQSGPD